MTFGFAYAKIIILRLSESAPRYVNKFSVLIKIRQLRGGELTSSTDPRKLSWHEVVRLECIPTLGTSVYDRALAAHKQTAQPSEKE